MKLYNLKDHNEQVSFAQAIKQGLGKNQGLFFPLELPEFDRKVLEVLREPMESGFIVIARARDRMRFPAGRGHRGPRVLPQLVGQPRDLPRLVPAVAQGRLHGVP